MFYMLLFLFVLNIVNLFGATYLGDFALFLEGKSIDFQGVGDYLTMNFSSRSEKAESGSLRSHLGKRS